MSASYAPARWPSATATTVLWALAAASVVFWGLRLAAPSDAVAPPPLNNNAAAVVDPVAVAQMFGAVPSQAAVVATPDAASRFQLLGVVADADQQGAALISVDGQPAKPYRVGSRVIDGYVLHSLDLRAASLGASVNASPAFTLQLPNRPLAVNGPPPASAGVPPVVAPPPGR
ncbi:type II secretion system protein N [Variovorax sp. KK3]|uniref:type II secretion system protein N n=1 Tax=Variovorax sp. KK3 TaxID=1855728 RepID=UPI00097C9CBD|nr:type II secretion system protein N [Variovorax sp. KK3]